VKVPATVKRNAMTLPTYRENYSTPVKLFKGYLEKPGVWRFAITNAYLTEMRWSGFCLEKMEEGRRSTGWRVSRCIICLRADDAFNGFGCDNNVPQWKADERE